MNRKKGNICTSENMLVRLGMRCNDAS